MAQLAFRFPEGFPLDGVDREIFAHQVRDVFFDPGPDRLSDLDRLRTQTGRAPLYAHYQRDVLETLLSMMRTSHEMRHRDALIAKTAEYLGIEITHVPDAPSGTTESVDADKSPGGETRVDVVGRHVPIWVRFKSLIIWTVISTLLLVIYLLFFKPTPSGVQGHETQGTVSNPHEAAPYSLDNAGSTSNDASGTDMSGPVVNVSVDTRQPAWVLASLAKLAPATPGEYVVELKVTPIQADFDPSTTGR